MASSINLVDELNSINKTYPYRVVLPDTELLSIPDEEDEDDLDELLNLPSDFLLETNIPFESPIELSSKKLLSRSYQFIKLEHDLTIANLLKTKDDRRKFHHDYLQCLRENKFNNFLEKYHKKLTEENERIKQERILKRTRTFTFVDLEKNFLAQDPTRDIKIVFIDDPIISSSSKFQTVGNIQQNSLFSIESDVNVAIEAFYENRSRRLLRNPSCARDEITLFARYAGERLHQRLPHLVRVPHRVKIVDERETKRNVDDHTLLQLKHKYALSLITKRRQLVQQMMLQTKKNQIKMKQLNFQSPLTMINSTCCQELLEKTNQIEQMYKQHSQIDTISHRTISKTTNYSSTITNTSTPSFSSYSTTFQDGFSLYSIDDKFNTIQSKRPLTAPMKKNTLD